MSQYQHFIPQFILRKYGEYKEPKRDDYAENDSETWKTAKKKAQKKAGVNAIIFENGPDKMTLERRNCKKICGLNDMYGREIEDMFGKLEKKTSDIIKKLESDVAKGESSTRLPRAEVDEIRRFLFIMLYRSRNFLHRFETSAEEYDSRDREPLLAYMKAKGFATPRDVWLDNFRTFLQVPLGPNPRAWEAELMKRAYPEDAKWFIHHVNDYFLYFCKPADDKDGFILTQNAYGVFEGPNSSAGWTDWHFFSPINPQLLIVLRNKLIQPIPTSVDRSPLVNAFLERLVNLNLAIHSDPTMVRSWLWDLPVETTQHSGGGMFEFTYLPISSRHVQSINSIFLDNAASTKLIIYSSERALIRALEFFLQLDKRGLKIELPDSNGTDAGLILKAGGEEIRKVKNVEIHGYEPYLLGLENVVTKLESKVKASWRVPTPDGVELIPPLPPNFATRYKKLG
jgi:Protein of unknown function (DUF4238)